MEVQVQRTAETLDQRHRAGARRLAREAGLLDQVAGDDPVDDAEHPARDRWTAGKQEAQRLRKAQDPLAHRLLGVRMTVCPLDKRSTPNGQTGCLDWNQTPGRV